MTYEEFNAFCGALPVTTHVVQWGGAEVWKVGGKVFAIGGWGDDQPGFTFKTSPLSFEILKDQPGLRPAPYLASRGMKWIQHYAEPGLSDEDLKDYLRQSHLIVSQGLSKKKQRELGLIEGVSETRPDRIAQGIGIILASVVTMAFADAVVKLVSADLTLWQVFAARSLFAVPFLVALVYAKGTGLRLLSAKWVFVRSALLVLTWLAFYASLPVLDLSVAAVAVYTNPIITALLSAALLGERVSGRQWLGVLTGFLGVAVILKPGSEAFSWMVLLPLLGAVFYSLAMVLTRSKCQNEGAVTLALGLHGAFIVTGLAATGVLAVAGLDADMKEAYPFLLGDWAAMGGKEWALMALLGGLSAAFFLGVARAYQIAPPQVIAVFDYGYLVSAAVWGFVFFSEEPDRLTILGMILITVAGLLVTSRSARPASARKEQHDRADL